MEVTGPSQEPMTRATPRGCNRNFPTTDRQESSLGMRDWGLWYFVDGIELNLPTLNITVNQ